MMNIRLELWFYVIPWNDVKRRKNWWWWLHPRCRKTPGKLYFLYIIFNYLFDIYEKRCYIGDLPCISWQLISSRIQLSESFDQVINVETLDSKDAANLALLERPELGITFTKVNCWKLTQFSKCVFLDADTLVSNLEIF